MFYLILTACLGVIAPDPQDENGIVIAFTENFFDQSQRDALRTSASWGIASPGALQPGKGGGSGIHGDLILRSGQTLVIDTDQHLVPADQTLIGVPLFVTDGTFQFSTLKVEAGAMLRFSGDHGVKIFTAAADIEGTVDVSGETAPLHHSENSPCPVVATNPWIANDTSRGGAGGKGGPGAGDGGSGGDDPRPIGPPPGGMPDNPGTTRLAPEHLDGEDGQGIGGGGTSAGGGEASPMFPATMISAIPAQRLAAVTLTPIIQYSVQKAGGAGGASFASRGASGQTAQPSSGPSGAAGALPTFDPGLPPALALGGAGGGGAGVHCYFTNKISSRLLACPARYPAGSRPQIMGEEIIEVWHTGCGGGGGGGYLYLQCGADLDLQGFLLARGGDGGSAAAFGTTQPQTAAGTGGGGGSGGALRVDVGGALHLGGSGNLDVLGGLGGRSSLLADGGEGGHGAVHLRADPAPGAISASVNPPGAETTSLYGTGDHHPLSTAVSEFYAVAPAGASFSYVDLVITFAIRRPGAPVPADPRNPQHVVYLSLPASEFLNFAGPLYVSYQGEAGDAQGQPIPGTRTSWTLDLTALGASENRLRFAVVLDRRWFEPFTPIVGITRVELLIDRP